jgi:hypothetical protein
MPSPEGDFVSSEERRFDFDPDLMKGAKALVETGDEDTAKVLVEKAGKDIYEDQHQQDHHGDTKGGIKAEKFMSEGDEYAENDNYFEDRIFSVALKMNFGRVGGSGSVSEGGVRRNYRNVDGKELFDDDPRWAVAKEYVDVFREAMAGLGIDYGSMDDTQARKISDYLDKSIGGSYTYRDMSSEERIAKFRKEVRKALIEVME